jgi:hypothetical protein
MGREILRAQQCFDHGQAGRKVQSGEKGENQRWMYDLVESILEQNSHSLAGVQYANHIIHCLDPLLIIVVVVIINDSPLFPSMRTPSHRRILLNIFL